MPSAELRRQPITSLTGKTEFGRQTSGPGGALFLVGLDQNRTDRGFRQSGYRRHASERGVIRLPGSFTEITVVGTINEGWHGFTIGVEDGFENTVGR